MVPTEYEGDAQSYAVGTLASAPLSPKLTDSHSDAVRQRTNEASGWSQPIAGKSAVISIGVVDEKSFTRECITRSLQALDDRMDIASFATCDDCLQHVGGRDLILYNAREAAADWDHNSEEFLSFKKLLNMMPVIILSDLDCPDSLTEIFESGARGFIPTAHTTLEQLIEIIRLVKAGGTFVPLSSLSLRRTKAQSVTRTTRASYQFTPSELAVLDRLKLGKPNKIIAHELGVSESTVKVRIGRIMKKLKATNRTQILSRAYALSARLMPLLPVTSTLCSLGGSIGTAA
jgi:DNA-binding NarL/FixJ family response regulator